MPFKQFWPAHVELSILGEEDPGAAMDQCFLHDDPTECERLTEDGLREFAAAESTAIAAAEMQSVAVVCVSIVMPTPGPKVSFTPETHCVRERTDAGELSAQPQRNSSCY